MPAVRLPEVLVRLDNSVWPVEPGLPAGTGRCSSWSIERELVANSLPGQIRAQSGFSVGQARVTIRQAEGRPLAPWAAPDRRVTAGTTAVLEAWDEPTGQRVQMGRWLVSEVSGSLTSAQVPVTLDEAQYAGRTDIVRLPAVRDVDPAFVLDRLARQMGFHSTPRPNAGSVLTVPLCGGLLSTQGLPADIVPSDAQWDESTGIPGVRLSYGVSWSIPSTPAADLYLTLNVAGTVTALLPVTAAAVTVTVTGSTVKVGTGATVSYAPGLDDHWPTRVQVRIQVTGSTVTVQARSSESAPWSSASTTSGAFEPVMSSLTIGGTGSVSALDLSTSPVGQFAAPTAVMRLMGAKMSAPWFPAGTDVWTAVRQICDAYAVAARVRDDDILEILTRSDLTGAGRPKRPIDVDADLEDLPWSIVADDYADRLEVTFQSVTWPEPDADPYETAVGDGKVRVPAGRSVTVAVNLGGYVETLAPWFHVDAPEMPDVASEWQANTAEDGTGAVVTSLPLGHVHRSPAEALVTIWNPLAVDVWMVDEDGSPAMTLRGTGNPTFDARIVEFGAGAASALKPLTLDLGAHVASESAAREVGAYLWDRCRRRRYRVQSVRLGTPDLSIQHGDIVHLDHSRSGLSTNALVARVEQSEDGTRLDLVALPPTYDDFAGVWRGRTYADFAAALSGVTYATHSRDPLMTEA